MNKELIVLTFGAALPGGLNPNTTINKFLDLGQFAAGGVFGALLCWTTIWLTSRERAERAKIEVAHIKTMIEQLKLKDSRIDELHAMLTQLQKGKK